jgi:hypothetical protein
MLQDQPTEMRRSPQVVYLVGAGQCSVEATAESGGQHIGVVQDFGVGADPSDHVRVVTSPPRHATLRGSYNPSVRSTASVAVSFSPATPSVCDFARNEPLRNFLAGTCVIDIRQSGSSKGEASEARQSFTVHGPESTKTQLGTLTIQIYHVRPTLPVGPPGAQTVEQTPEQELWMGDETVGVVRVGVHTQREVPVENGEVVLQLKPGEYQILGAKAERLLPTTQTIQVKAAEQSVVKLDIGPVVIH